MTRNQTFPGSAGSTTMRRMVSARGGNCNGMEKQIYDKRSFRNLPREVCTVEQLLGDLAGPCTGLIHLHHSDPQDPSSKLVAVCAGHHPKLHALLRRLSGATERSETGWKRCNHRHPTHEGREACERKLNKVDRAA